MLEQDDVLLLCHKYPDGDTLGSAFALCRALRSLGKRVDVMCSDIIPSKFAYLYNGIEPFGLRPKFIVAIDVADTNLLGVLEKDYGDKIDLCIDHHASNRGYAKFTYADATASATGEVIFRMLPALGAELSQEIALSLYTAICTDTGCFRYSNVTPRTHKITAHLMETGIDFYEVNRVMFETRSLARIKLEHDMIDSMDSRMGGRLVMMVLSQKLIDAAGACEGDIDGLSSIPRAIEGVDVGILLREVDKGYKISVRTIPGIDAGAICKQLGGGGHSAAAGCFVKGCLDEAKDAIYDAALAIFS